MNTLLPSVTQLTRKAVVFHVTIAVIIMLVTKVVTKISTCLFFQTSTEND